MARTAKPKEETTATKTRAKREPKTTETKTVEVKTATVTKPVIADKRDMEIENLKAELEQMKQLLAEQAKQPQTVYVNADNSERVWFLWLADVSDENQILIGEHGQFGRIVGKTGRFYVPKNNLSSVMDSAMRFYLENRWMIVISGLTDEEREALGVNYRKGEIMDETMFRRLMSMGKDELLEIYPALCKAHKQMIASTFHETFESGKPIERGLVIELNKIEPDEAYKDIIEKMNAKDV